VETSTSPATDVEIGGTVDTLRWFTDMNEATSYAKSSDRTVLMVFAGSDWCRPCKQFRQAVLDDTGFKQDFAEQLTVLYLDFPAKRRNKLPAEQTAANEALAERYNPTGVFPKLLLLSPEEAQLGELSYRGEDAASFSEQLTGLLASDND